MVKFGFVAALLAGLAMAAPSPKAVARSVTPSVMETGIESKPEPDFANIRITEQNYDVVAVVNTFVLEYLFGQTSYIEAGNCYYLPNLLGQATWVKPDTLNTTHVVFFHQKRDCSGPKIVAQPGQLWDIHQFYSMSAELIDLSDEEEEYPFPNSTTTALQGARPAIEGRSLKSHK